MFTLAAFLLSIALVLNAPLLVLVFLGGRRRLHHQLGSAIVATGFGAATAYMIWRLEWFDVWRHGLPSTEYLLFGPAPWVLASGCAGWYLGRALATHGARTSSR